MMFAYAENVETRRISKLRCSEDLSQALLGANCLARLGVRRELSESIKSQLERR